MTRMDDIELPELSNEAAAHIERRVFADIGAQKEAAARRRKRRWVGGSLTAAAVVVGAALVVPQVAGTGFDTAASGGFGGDDAMDAAPEVAPEDGAAIDSDMASEEAAQAQDVAADGSDRDIIRTGWARVHVDDIDDATEALEQLAGDHEGYLEALGASQGEGEAGAASAWATLRIPASELDAVRSGLGDIGEVTGIEISQRDVTDQTVDLAARIEAHQASVDRLLELMEQSGSVGDLIQAEEALAQRQAELESLQGQLDHLEGQVAMSTLEVHMDEARTVEQAEPAGFLDGLLSGWNGLMATLNGAVIVVGALIPWLGVAGVIALAVWGVVRLRRRR